MPPRASHRLDAHLVPPDLTDGAVGAVRALWDAWQEAGVLAGSGPGPLADAVVTGGFAGARCDDPGAVVLYANQVGGFQVRCPDCGVGLGRELRPHDVTRCPACGGAFALESLDIRPPVARGRASLVLVDVADSGIRRVPEDWRLVLRRVG